MIYKCPKCYTYSETKDVPMAVVICPCCSEDMRKVERDIYNEKMEIVK